MTLADKINRIIHGQEISKAEFARRLGVSANYIYILTGNSRSNSNKNKTISPALAKLIALEFGCSEEWLLCENDNAGMN
ncbi:hypothetical protein SDC9_163772 [bioreactor metagenome]|uniref:HTH cro/C1-type domain-containing protein n=1 Tax=bioreactor metagenome TaxID=1076179 RepID=A0A645FS28_9ZZZZ